MAVKMEKDMRRDLFYHLQTLSFRFYPQTDSNTRRKFDQQIFSSRL